LSVVAVVSVFVSEILWALWACLESRGGKGPRPRWFTKKPRSRPIFDRRKVGKRKEESALCNVM